MMQRVEVVVDGVPVETWVASEDEAAVLVEEVLAAAEAGSTVRVEVRTANDEELVARGDARPAVGVRPLDRGARPAR